MKAVEFPDLGISTDIPRPILMNHVAVRFAYTTEDLSAGDGDYFSVVRLFFLGGG